MTSKQLAILIASGTKVEIVGTNGGWTTVLVSGTDENRKVRNGQLRRVTDVNAPTHVEVKEEEQPAVVDQHLLHPDLSRYTQHDVKSPSGRKALDIDDEAAKALRGHDISDCCFIVAKNIASVEKRLNEVEKIEAGLVDSYKHLNIGMQRMNLGNRLRKAMGIYGSLNAHHKAAAAINATDGKIVKPTVTLTKKVTKTKPVAKK